jgi:hypothetical protein
MSLRYKIGVSKDHAQVTANWDISKPFEFFDHTRLVFADR